MYILEGEVVVGIEFQDTDSLVELLDGTLALLPRILHKQPLCIIGFDIEYLFSHEFLHTLGMKALKAVLKTFVGVSALFVLELNLLKILFLNLVHQFADEEGHQSVEGILLFRNVIVAQNLLKTVYYFIIGSEVA